MAAPATPNEKNSRAISTAACLIIGDEVLNGKIADTNSTFFARWCFSLGISLKRVEVIEDDEEDIKEAVKRLSDRYDLVVTSGGIGPTHDDITYQSIANAFGLPLLEHQETFERMKKLAKRRDGEPPFDWTRDTPAREAKMRMVRMPTDTSRALDKQFIFTKDDLWVPINVVNGNIHILPGIPRLFEGMLEGLKPIIHARLIGKSKTRVMISTPLTESQVAEYLTELQNKVKTKGVSVGSYPRWGKKRNTVTLTGMDQDYIESITPEVLQKVKGRVIKVEGEDDELPDPE
ncbi:Molybdopterin binding protein [Thozetella sp. PMI_491]|nr:Molybdopterin binding protein [Thozetella sp. PMI_491]